MTCKIINENGLNVEYMPLFYEVKKANEYLKQLKELPFFTPTFKIRGKCIQPNRKILAFGDTRLRYIFSGAEITALPWTPLLLQLRDDVEKQVGCTYNYVLLNYYEDGTSAISQHKDNESCLNSTFPIAVLNFGQTRTLTFKKPNCKSTSLNVKHGSLYVMYPPTNDEFTHGIPPDPSAKKCRISLTFRHILPEVPDLPAKKRKIMSDIADWYLDGNILLSVQCEDSVVRIYLKNTSNTEYIVMTPQTWGQFAEKIFFFNTLYTEASFIANNELCVFSQNQYCMLQELFNNLSDGFKLKCNFLRMEENNLNLLKVYSEEIGSIIQNTLLCVILPSIIRKKCKISEDVTEVDFLRCVYKEVQRNIQFMYPCAGCIVKHPNQGYHDCITLSHQTKYFLKGETAIFHLNFTNICNELVSYNEKCFQNLSLEYIKHQFELYNEMYE